MHWRQIKAYVMSTLQLRELGVTLFWVPCSFTILQLYEKRQSSDITFRVISVEGSLLELELYGTKT